MDKIKSKEILKKLIRGDTVREPIVQNIVYKNIKTEPRSGWNFLLQSGYLKASEPRMENVGQTFLLQIPNVEVLSLIKNMVMYWFNEKQSVRDEIEDLVTYLEEENWPLFEDRLQGIFFSMISYYDTASVHPLKEKAERIKYENFYHGLFLGLLVQLQDKYVIESNREYGLGRPDLVVLPMDKRRTAFIFEFKAVKTTDVETPEAAAQDAIKQCDRNKYAMGLNAKGYKNFQVIGIGFKGKELKMLWSK
ncbi:MAG: PD-(D/E)XK nuclease domain-containing protein [Cyanobacteria bacterium P01_F01_bin.150]